MKTKIIGASENITEGNIKEKLPLIKHHKNSRSNVASPLNLKINEANAAYELTSRNLSELRSQTIAHDIKQEFSHMILNSFSLPNPNGNKPQLAESNSNYVKGKSKNFKIKKNQKEMNTQTVNMSEPDSDSDMSGYKQSPKNVTYQPIPGLNVFK